MSPMYSMATILRGVCLLAAITAICGCRKAPEQPEPQRRTHAETQPVPQDKPSQLGPRARNAVRSGIKKLRDPDRWRRMAQAGLQKAVQAGDRELDDPMTHIRAGDKALANGQTELSIACFQRAVGLDKKNADAHRGLAMAITTLAAGKNSIIDSRKLYRRAVEVYRAILAISPDDETARFNLALALMRSGSETQAGEAFRPLLTSEKFATEAAFNLATVLSSQGKIRQAETLLRELISNDKKMGSSDRAAAHTLLGEVLFDLDDTKGSLEAYTEAARLTPKDVAAWLNLAASARAAGSYGYAVTATRKAAALSPFNAEIHLRLGNVLLELHRATHEERFLTEAVAAWRNSLKVDPSQSDLQRRVDVYGRTDPKTPPTKATPNR